jgi:hypothetical protein
VRPRFRLTTRNTAVAFYALEALALPLLLRAGRNSWFNVDDWDFLARRTAGSFHDLFRAHFNHWVTLPALVYRVLWPVAGLHYRPYQVVAVVLHLVAAALLRIVMLRSGVRPWLATLAALVLVAFGYGAENVLVAFQITFVGAFVLGLVQLLLSDHDGPFDRRDALGLLAGFGALLCSGVAITMIAVVALSVMRRRGWRMAAAHVIPLVAIFGAWFVTVGRYSKPSGSFDPDLGLVSKFLWVGVTTTFARLAYVPAIGVVLFAVLVIGLSVRGRPDRLAGSRGSALPIVMLCGALVFLAVAAVGRSGPVIAAAADTPTKRAFIPTHEQSDHVFLVSRYLYMTVALALPAIALACEALIERRRYAAVPLAALLLVGVPGNVREFSRFANGSVATQKSVRTLLLETPRLPLASKFPPSFQPSLFAPGVTIAWLRDALHDGRLPSPPASPRSRSTLALFLALQDTKQPESTRCRPIDTVVNAALPKGAVFTVKRGAIAVLYFPRNAPQSGPLVFHGPVSRVAIIGPLHVRFRPETRAPGAPMPVLCR